MYNSLNRVNCLKKAIVIVSAFFLLILFMLLELFLRRLGEHSDLYITEICVRNVASAYDDNGDYGADYIELYNASETDIDLSEYYISDGNNRNIVNAP